MVTLLANLFIKNNKEYRNPQVRREYGLLCGFVGIGFNIILFAIKFLAGMISGSVAITADAFNNLSDAGSSVVTLLGFKIAGNKPDPEHPFGHGRVEYISGLLVSIIIILMAWELLKSSVEKIIHPEPIESSIVVIIILVISILVKIYMSFYNRSIGNKIDSAAMRATSMDSISDTLATTFVLVATIVAALTNLKIDGYCGVIVSLFVFWAGFNATKDTIGPLLGQPPEPEFVAKIEEIVMSHKDDGALGIHDLIVHDYGPGRVFISVHVEVPCDRDILEMHDMIDLIEQELQNKLSCGAVIHMDPISTNDPLTNEYKSIVEDALLLLNRRYPESKVSFHDFRMVKGPTHTNLIFDIVLPFDYKIEDAEAVKFIQEYVHHQNEMLFCAINVDKAYA